MKLLKEIEALAHGYSRKGGKDNRRQQRARMLAFGEHCAAMGADSLGQLGARHVISYWRSNRDLGDRTLYAHWLAVRQLWQLAGKGCEPPRPRLAADSKHSA
nr:hypothetical protein pM02_c6_31 [uncultured bacterium]